jgi:hypothetical protein
MLAWATAVDTIAWQKKAILGSLKARKVARYKDASRVLVAIGVAL